MVLRNMLHLLRLCALVALVVAAAKSEEQQDNNDYTIEVGNYSDCKYLARFNTLPKSDNLHTPRLGIQRRKLRCRTDEGNYVSFKFCRRDVEIIGLQRMCLMPQDCVMGNWSTWQASANGKFVRWRKILQLPQGGGKDCDVVEEVNLQSPADSATGHWITGPWGECHVAKDEANAAPPRRHRLYSRDPETGGLVPKLSWTKEDYDDYAVKYDYEITEYDKEKMDKYDMMAKCGGGVQRREAVCARDPDDQAIEPTKCEHAKMPTLVQPCEVPCPRDCQVGEWSDWGACQPTDGCPLFPVQQLTTTGYSVRKRRVVSAASGGGAPCPPLEEKRNCATPRCASWKPLPWSACSLNDPHASCGTGKRTRELRCVGHDGKEAERAWCSGPTPATIERCRIACAGDCVVSAWGAWTHCSANCATPGLPPPTRVRIRHILAHASASGWPCPSEEQLVQRETCNTHACASYAWLAMPWSPCTPNADDYPPASNYTDFLDGDTFSESSDDEPCVEEGMMTRDVLCVQTKDIVVREALCAPLKRPAARRACTVRCHRGCKVGPWSEWSSCNQTCGPSSQTRTRKVLGGPNCGALTETRPCPVPTTCVQEYSWQVGNWSQCYVPPYITCGEGKQARNIWCTDHKGKVGLSKCAGLPAPPSSRDCVVPCSHHGELTCEEVCKDALRYYDYHNLQSPDCVCKNVTLEVLPSDSDCILPKGASCYEGRKLRAARCKYEGRDVPMYICRKYHPLSGPSRVWEPSTDGLTYDLEFPDHLREPCHTFCTRDCTVGPWGEWGPCTAEAGSLAAYRFRSREVLVENTPGGRECVSTLQRSSCTLQAPQWRVGEWSVCTPRRGVCGSSLIYRIVSCIDAEDRSVESSLCEAISPKPAHEAKCQAPCPGDCVVSAWSEWSPCEKTKWGGGRRDRTRVVLRPAEDDGGKCPPLVGAEVCSPHAYSWHVGPWDDCQPLGGSPCGEGLKRRSVRCLRSDGVFVNDSFCPNTTNRENSESWCYVPCGVDCELSEWSPWDSSACSCGQTSSASHMRRTRHKIVDAVWPGRACEALEQRVPCPRNPCMKLISTPDRGCNVKPGHPTPVKHCGYASKLSYVRCEVVRPDEDTLDLTYTLDAWRCTEPLPGRMTLPSVGIEEEPCEIRCGCEDDLGDGEVQPWESWSPCTLGVKWRTRDTVAPPKPACPTPSRHMEIEWSNCSDSEPDVQPLNDEATDMLDDTDDDEAEVITHEEKPRVSVIKDHEIYKDKLNESNPTASFLSVLWFASFILCLYGLFMLYRTITGYVLHSRVKTVAKV